MNLERIVQIASGKGAESEMNELTGCGSAECFTESDPQRDSPPVEGGMA
jgi:hypothetical protein